MRCTVVLTPPQVELSIPGQSTEPKATLEPRATFEPLTGPKGLREPKATLELRVSNRSVLIPAYIYWCDIINPWLVYRADGNCRTECFILNNLRPVCAFGGEGHTRTMCIKLRVLIPAYIYWCDINNPWSVYRAEGLTRTACIEPRCIDLSLHILV